MFDKFKKIEPSKNGFTVSDDEYLESLAALKGRPKRNIMPVLGTVAAAMFVLCVVTTWALVGRGLRIKDDIQQNEVAVPAEDGETESEKQPERPKDDKTEGIEAESEKPDEPVDAQKTETPPKEEAPQKEEIPENTQKEENSDKQTGTKKPSDSDQVPEADEPVQNDDLPPETQDDFVIVDKDSVTGEDSSNDTEADDVMWNARSITVYTNDIFMGKIVSAKTVVVDSTLKLPNIIFNEGDRLKLCRVTIGNVYYSTVVAPDTTVYVLFPIHDGYDTYEIGESYVISGIVQPFEDKLVIVDLGMLNARIGDDGAFIPNCDSTARELADVQTLDLFERSFAVNIVENKLVYTESFYDIAALIPDDESQQQEQTALTVQQVIEKLSQAIIVENNIKINDWQEK